MKSLTTILLSAGSLLAATSAAHGAFLSDFDAYPAGTSLQGVDGWTGWGNDAGSAGVVSDLYALSGSNSIEIGRDTDAVRQYTGVTFGQWSLTMKQYIPSGQNGLTYVTVMNEYVDGGSKSSGQTSAQLKFNLSAGTVRDDFTGGNAPIATDEWVDVRFDVDLDADRVDTYYNGALISTGSWTRDGASPLALSALDLYAVSKNDAFYDDISLTRAVPSPGAPALCLCGMICLLPHSRSRRGGRYPPATTIRVPG